MSRKKRKHKSTPRPSLPEEKDLGYGGSHGYGPGHGGPTGPGDVPSNLTRQGPATVVPVPEDDEKDPA